VSALIAPFYVWWFKPQYTFPVSMLSCLILLRHHDNIQRLWRRQETRIWTRLKKEKNAGAEINVAAPQLAASESQVIKVNQRGCGSKYDGHKLFI
jgi:glycerol-3-phosphate acyltransferase PlsY